MPLIRRRAAHLPLEPPRLEGASWPNRRDFGRPSFAASALYQMGYREAFEPEAHDIADLLVEQMLPELHIDVASVDAPYLRRVFSTAAQIGAGIGIVERRGSNHDEQSTDRQFGGALLVAAGELPAMPRRHKRIALYLLHCGYYVARTELRTIPRLVDALSREPPDKHGI